ncbi:MAG: hypothetical protein R2827_01305 [Bdellovibrionales bacterium]
MNVCSKLVKIILLSIALIALTSCIEKLSGNINTGSSSAQLKLPNMSLEAGEGWINENAGTFSFKIIFDSITEEAFVLDIQYTGTYASEVLSGSSVTIPSGVTEYTVEVEFNNDTTVLGLSDINVILTPPVPGKFLSTNVKKINLVDDDAELMTSNATTFINLPAISMNPGGTIIEKKVGDSYVYTVPGSSTDINPKSLFPAVSDYNFLGTTADKDWVKYISQDSSKLALVKTDGTQLITSIDMSTVTGCDSFSSADIHQI